MNLWINRKFLHCAARCWKKDFARMNDRQKQAVFTVNGPLLILAGAGSGKTTVLINRIANILRYGDAYNSTYLRDDLDENDIAACKAILKTARRSQRKHRSI